MRRRDRRLAKERAREARRETVVALAVLGGGDPQQALARYAEGDLADAERVIRRIVKGERVGESRWQRARAALGPSGGKPRLAFGWGEFLPSLAREYMQVGHSQDEVIARIAAELRARGGLGVRAAGRSPGPGGPLNSGVAREARRRAARSKGRAP